LAVKSLNGVVRREHFVPESEYLQTVLVAVPKISAPEFVGKYERLTAMVVPRSLSKISEDEEFILYAVVVFKRVAEEYISKLRDEKYTPRDFVYDEKRIEDEKKELMELGSSAKEQSAAVLRLCKTNFGELFLVWMHVIALRVFVDAVLRYGLPPDFQPMMIKSRPKMEKKTVDTLARHFAALGSSLAKGSAADDAVEEIQGVSVDKEYFPYVHFAINWPYQQQ
jgi:V-type H+-transporting ATPase subunit C